MRADQWLFHVLGLAPKSRVKVCAQWGSLGLRWLDAGRSVAVVLVSFLLYVIWSRCFMSYFVFYC